MSEQPKVCAKCGKPTEIVTEKMGFDAATGKAKEVRFLRCVSYRGISGHFQSMSDVSSGSPIPSHTMIAL
jgi:hypothetical protein